MKQFIKTKRMRRLIKQARIHYKNECRNAGVRHIRQTKLCSECDPNNCICADNQRAHKLIGILDKFGRRHVKETLIPFF